MRLLATGERNPSRVRDDEWLAEVMALLPHPGRPLQVRLGRAFFYCAEIPGLGTTSADRPAAAQAQARQLLPDDSARLVWRLNDALSTVTAVRRETLRVLEDGAHTNGIRLCEIVGGGFRHWRTPDASRTREENVALRLAWTAAVVMWLAGGVFALDGVHTWIEARSESRAAAAAEDAIPKLEQELKAWQQGLEPLYAAARHRAEAAARDRLIRTALADLQSAVEEVPGLWFARFQLSNTPDGATRLSIDGRVLRRTQPLDTTVEPQRELVERFANRLRASPRLAQFSIRQLRPEPPGKLGFTVQIDLNTQEGPS